MNKNKVTREELAAYFRAEGDMTTKEKVNVDFFLAGADQDFDK